MMRRDPKYSGMGCVNSLAKKVAIFWREGESLHYPVALAFSTEDYGYTPRYC
jgi:hypothetical protein